MKQWHNLDIDKVQSATSETLVTNEVRKAYQEKHGKNKLQASEKDTRMEEVSILLPRCVNVCLDRCSCFKIYDGKSN